MFFPTQEVLWRGERSGDEFTVEPAEKPAQDAPYALIGVRSCDLSALGIHDTVLMSRVHKDSSYADRRSEAFVVAVTCSDPGGTCFCVSMGTGPHPEPGRGAPYDLSLTELVDGGRHRFVVEVASERGAEVMDEIGSGPAPDDELGKADHVAEDAAGRMGRSLDTFELKELLYANAESPIWDAVAERCLSCTNCTAVCPTCFCTSVEDVTDLSGDVAGRDRVWDSCFNADFSYIHGGTVRAIDEVALPAVDDPQARLVDRPVRHVRLRGLRAMHHLVSGRDRHHRGGRGAARRGRGGVSDHADHRRSTCPSTRSSPVWTTRRSPW